MYNNKARDETVKILILKMLLRQDIFRYYYAIFSFH